MTTIIETTETALARTSAEKKAAKTARAAEKGANVARKKGKRERRPAPPMH